MDFSFTPEQEKLRVDIGKFLENNLTSEYKNVLYDVAGVGVSKEFTKMLAKNGWIGMQWPENYGGAGMGIMEYVIYREEMVMRGAPIGYHLTAENQMAPSIIINGTDEQKQRIIPSIAKGEMSICIGYSEPNTGSDLASLQTRAEEDGDDFIINGVKTWNSGAIHSELIWLAARTNHDVPKHKGITVFLVELDSPGVTIDPIQNMARIGGFSNITFDNVRVPKSNIVGELDQGWYVVAQNLDFERSGIERVASNYSIIHDFLEYIKTNNNNTKNNINNSLVRNRIADMFIEVEVGRYLAYNIAWMQSKGLVPNKEASISKVFGAETTKRNSQAMLEILGMYGGVNYTSNYSPIQGRVLRSWFGGISSTIAAGTSEIQRNIIAMRGLGLPRT